MEDQARKVCSMLAGKFGNRKQSDYLGTLQEVFYQNRGELLEYQMTVSYNKRGLAGYEYPPAQQQSISFVKGLVTLIYKNYYT